MSEQSDPEADLLALTGFSDEALGGLSAEARASLEAMFGGQVNTITAETEPLSESPTEATEAVDGSGMLSSDAAEEELVGPLAAPKAVEGAHAGLPPSLAATQRWLVEQAGVLPPGRIDHVPTTRLRAMSEVILTLIAADAGQGEGGVAESIEVVRELIKPSGMGRIRRQHPDKTEAWLLAQVDDVAQQLAIARDAIGSEALAAIIEEELRPRTPPPKPAAASASTSSPAAPAKPRSRNSAPPVGEPTLVMAADYVVPISAALPEVWEDWLATEEYKASNWQDSALCAQTDPEAFFPEKGGSTREAKKVCRSCDVRTECLEYALDHDERYGIWGGLSERERRRLKRGSAVGGEDEDGEEDEAEDEYEAEPEVDEE